MQLAFATASITLCPCHICGQVCAQFLQGQAKGGRVLEADSQLLAVAIFSPLELTAYGSLTWGRVEMTLKGCSFYSLNSG